MRPPPVGDPTSRGSGAAAHAAIDACERLPIAPALAAHDANAAAAADHLAVPRKTLCDQLKKYQLRAGRAAE
jgi:two-component system C4-dicarboxylate transport response regulator DctD